MLEIGRWRVEYECWRLEGGLRNMRVDGGIWMVGVGGWRVEYECGRLEFGGWNMEG